MYLAKIVHRVSIISLILILVVLILTESMARHPQYHSSNNILIIISIKEVDRIMNRNYSFHLNSRTQKVKSFRASITMIDLKLQLTHTIILIIILIMVMVIQLQVFGIKEITQSLLRRSKKPLS